MKDAGVNAHAAGANLRDDFVDDEARAWSEGQLWTRLYGPDNKTGPHCPYRLSVRSKGPPCRATAGASR